MKNKLVSIVISAYNEEGNVAKLYQELDTVTHPLKVDFEFSIVRRLDISATWSPYDLSRAAFSLKAASIG